MRIAMPILITACGATATPGPANTGTSALQAPLELTWLAYPMQTGEDEIPRTPITLLAGAERIELEPMGGALISMLQVECEPVTHPLGPDQVARVTVEAGGEAGYLVKRGARGLDIMQWSQSHEACADHQVVPCPPDHGYRERRVRTLDVPRDIRVIQRVLVVDEAGKQAPIECPRLE